MNQQKQQFTAGDATQYLAQVCNTYAQSLDEVARKPFIAHVNNCFGVLENHREGQREQIDKLARELQEAQENQARPRVKKPGATE